jgi:hypothetical protein
LARRLKTMPALIWEKEPFKLSANYLFSHSHKLIGIKGEICRVLV